MLNLKDDLKQHSSIITDSFDSLMSVQECAQRLKQAGFPFDEQTDLIYGSRFLEAVRDILHENAALSNQNPSVHEFTLEFALITGGGQKPRRKSIVLLIMVIDSAMSGKSILGKDTSNIVQGLITRLRSEWPAFLTWLPGKYLRYVNSIQQS